MHLHQYQPGGREKNMLQHPAVSAGDECLSKHETLAYSKADFTWRLTFDISCSQSWSRDRVTSALLIIEWCKIIYLTTLKGSAGLSVAKRCNNSDYFSFVIDNLYGELHLMRQVLHKKLKSQQCLFFCNWIFTTGLEKTMFIGQYADNRVHCV